MRDNPVSKTTWHLHVTLKIERKKEREERERETAPEDSTRAEIKTCDPDQMRPPWG